MKLYVVDDNLKNLILIDDNEDRSDIFAGRTRTAVSLLRSVAEMACEYDSDLDLTRLVNYLHLYRLYLQAMQSSGSEMSKFSLSEGFHYDSVVTQSLAGTRLASFERFVRDHGLLGLAAAEASRESGEKVATPPPLMESANQAL